jgi:predicted transposase YdaD
MKERKRERGREEGRKEGRGKGWRKEPIHARDILGAGAP